MHLDHYDNGLSAIFLRGMGNSANHYSKLSQSNLIIKLKYNKILRIIKA
jgi:hypothetical protein